MTNIEKPAYISKEQKNGITQELLKEYFEYRDGGLYWIKVASYRGKIGTKAGYISKHKNDSRNVIGLLKGIQYFAARLIFLYHHNYLPKVVDHIDRDSMNDRIENLREATQQDNLHNSTSKKGSSSQYLGVSWCKRDKKWKAQICIDWKQTFIGRFKTEVEAALAYNRMAVKYFKEFANLNIIQPKL